MTKPWKEPAPSRRASPLWDADRIEAPLLLFAGGADDAHPAEQSRRLYKRLSQREADVTLYTYPELRSSVYTPSETVLDRLERTEQWLEDRRTEKTNE